MYTAVRVMALMHCASSYKVLSVYRESNTTAHVLLSLLNELGKSDKMLGLPSILSLFAMSVINAITQEYKC